MFSRPPSPWLRRAVAAAVLTSPLAASAAAGACADSPPAVAALAIGSGVMRDGEESRVEVRAHPDGCVAVRRPWFLRDAGDYELRLSVQEWASLRDAIAIDALRGIDPKRLSAQTGGTWEASNGQTVFTDLDTDVYVLQWLDGSEQRRLVARDPLQAAARHPEATVLNRVAGAIDALRGLSRRTGKRVATEATP
ncbi:hypothetical protein [Dokdonella sp.]|uniref:hypothetical protein n=1 Tax=Dokdonella sp. TaxID=2291710 RepID=UPI002610137E|nr:hypothetical protein [Dokdonella sp.]